MLPALALSAVLGLEPARGVVRWDAPASCPAQDEVVAAIGARVPIDAIGVQASVEEKDGELVAEVVIDSAHGTTKRTLQSPSCASLVDALVLLAQVAAEPSPFVPAPIAEPPIAEPPAEPIEAPTTAPEVAPSEPAIAATSTTAAPPANDDAPQRPRADPRFRIAAAAIVGAGTLPGIDLGVRGVVGIATRWVHADVGALYLGPRRIDPRDDVRVTIDAWGLLARVCPVIPLPLRRLELSACAVATVGQLRGRADGTGLRDGKRDTQPFVRVAIAPELGVVLHPRVRLVGAVEVGGHVARPGFALRGGPGRVWAPQRWAVHGLVGVELRLP
ncbi:MAG TPA: hypothetical protein VG755_09045 [Nannocystaceae bacterium]|nr:hypothetical protein [Nannocystaceae bacterium]